MASKNRLSSSILFHLAIIRKMNHPKITIITVCFNAVDVIEKTILSVVNQTYQNIEYIIVDGGSTDGTIDIIKKYEDQIDKWISEPDDGIYDAMNKGIRMATGEWLNFMNAGDWFYSDSVVEKVFSKKIPESLMFIYSDCELRYTGGRAIIQKTCEKTGDIYHQASIYKKCLHSEYGYYSCHKPIIISDVLFFYLIPSSLYYHTDTVIASFDMGGISNKGEWCKIQISCLKYIFNKISFNSFVYRVLKHFIKSLLPDKFIVWIKTWKAKS